MPGRADDVTGVGVQDEAIVFINETMEPDLPGLAVARIGDMRIGHNDVFLTVALNALDPRIFVRKYSVGGTLRQHLLKFVTAPVARGENQNIRDVIDEARPLVAVAPVTVADTAGE